MKKSTQKIFLIVSFILFLGIGIFVLINQKEDFKGLHLEPNEYLFLQRAYPYGKLKEDNLAEIENWKNNISFSSRPNFVNWQLVGPENVGGRITDIDIPSNNTQTYFASTATGGIFKTIDAGLNWNPIFDSEITLSIGDLDISKTNNNLILVGSGEPNSGGGSTTYDGNGVYLSNDAGATWTNKGLNNVGSIGKVIIDPINPNNMYVGAMGLLYAQNPNRGVYKSTDGGNSWTKTLFISNDTGVIDMAINPINPNIIYAATWQKTRTPITRVYGGINSDIYKSIDAGLTWTKLTAGLPTTTDKGRISIDISNSNPDILFATYTNTLGTSLLIRKSINAGANWTSIATTGITASPYNWWFGGVFINPTNSNNVFISEFNTHYSNTGGTPWNNAVGSTNAIHVDQHAVAFNSNGEILLGNDGGVYKSTDGINYSKLNNLPISQAYRMTVNPSNANQVYAGFQDNGTWRTMTGGYNDWNEIFGGDGMQPNVNPLNNNIIFVEYQYGVFLRSIDNAGSFGLSDNGISTTEPRNWDTPYVFDPANPNVMYFGTSNLYKSIDNGISWISISSNLSKGVYTGTQKYGTITSIDVSPLDSNLIYIGTDDGNVWKTIDGGINYTLLSTNLPNKWVTKVKASPNNINDVFVTYSGYRYNLNDSNVYFSSNQGTNWQDLTANLPNVPISDIEINQNNVLYIATDIGVFGSFNNGANWNLLGANMPNVVVTDLVLHVNSNFLFASTFGRGVYKIDLATLGGLSTNNPDLIEISDVKIYPNPTSDYLFMDLIFNQANDFDAKIYDTNGKFVKSFKLENQSEGKHSIKINVNDLQSGIYLLNINNEKNSRKFVVK